MREEELRQVLLVKAIEESDAHGVLIPSADRSAASRDAKRKVGGSAAPQDALLVARAQLLLRRITARHAFVEKLLALLGGVPWISWLLLALALALGFGLSALDGTRHIDIISFPLLGLVLWNVMVYVGLAIAVARKLAHHRARRGRVSALLADVSLKNAWRMIAQARTFDLSLSDALGRFTRQWYEAVKPLLVLRAKRVMHLAAAAVGIGLIAGLYLRGVAFDYRAGWDSTFLDASQVHALLSVLYAPALMLTALVLPDAAHLETIRWRNGAGENAAQWIHLLAATVAVFVVAPRLLMVLVASLGIWRLSRRAPVPPDLAAYYRRAFGAGERSVARIVPYAYEPTTDAVARLQTLLARESGEHLTLDMQPLLRYGDEEEFVAHLRRSEDAPAETFVILTSLAVTPEDENHGALMAEVRDWLAAASPRTQLLVVVDEGPYASRMSAQGAAPGRVDERRSLWRDFIAARGVTSSLADLSP